MVGIQGNKDQISMSLGRILELNEVLKKLPHKIQDQTMRKAMTQALRKFRLKARKYSPKRKTGDWRRSRAGFGYFAKGGNLRKSIVNRVIRRRKKGILSGSTYVVRKRHHVFYGHMPEYGTQTHIIKNFMGQKNNPVRVTGMKGQHFVERAWKSERHRALKIFQFLLDKDSTEQWNRYARKTKKP